ncbi:MAG TPA: hypothetical protein VFY39_07035, partial [Gammaproteobacteria bacterium]|nr:hypothetical protein [Gammaproteobacteria bacterium]
MTRSARKARRDPFALAAAGRAEVAFLWKSLLADAEYLRPRTALIAAAVITLGCLGLGSQPNFDAATSTIGMLSAVAAVYVLLFGPMFARQDFRRDLVNVDLLKVYPLPAWQIVAGELLTPVVVLT